MPLIQKRYRFILIALAVAALAWLVETALHVLVFKSGGFLNELIPPNSNEVWMRAAISSLIIAFGIYIQVAFNRQRQQFEQLKQVNRMFQTMIESMVGTSGNEFFRNTVHSLCDFLGADCAIIGEIDQGRIRALAMQLDNKFEDGFEYDLTGAPCAKVVDSGYHAYPEGVSELFPDDDDLVRMKAEGYVGIPIRDKQGRSIGVLCAISRQRLFVPEWTREMFDIIAAKAAAEIGNLRAIESSTRLLEKNRHLTRKLLSAQEEERRKMARDLHDEIGQTLTALKSHMALARQHSEESLVLQQVDRAEVMVDHMFRIVRSMLEELQPTSIDELGLKQALTKMIERWQDRNSIECNCQIEAGIDYLDYEVAVSCFRVIQEALTNIARHAGAGHVSIVVGVRENDKGAGTELYLKVADDGCGMENMKFGTGLTGMRERIEALDGEFTIGSSPGNGACITAIIPIFGKRNGE